MAKRKQFIMLWPGLITKKHYAKMGQAVWLFAWLLHETYLDGELPMYTHSMCMDAFGVSKITARRWLSTLRTQGYILVKKTRHGSTVKVKKWYGSSPQKEYEYHAGGIKNEHPEQEDESLSIVEDEHPSVSEDEHPSYKKNIKNIKKVSTPSPQQEMFGLLCVITRKDPKTMRGRIAKLGKQLREADYTIEDLQAAFGPDGNWWKHDWRGKKGQEPSMPQVLSEIGKYSGKVAGIQQAKPKTMAERAAEIDGGSNE